MGTERGGRAPLMVASLALLAAGLLLTGGQHSGLCALTMGVATVIGLGLQPAQARVRRRWSRLPRPVSALLVLPVGAVFATVVVLATQFPAWLPTPSASVTWGGQGATQSGTYAWFAYVPEADATTGLVRHGGMALGPADQLAAWHGPALLDGDGSGMWGWAVAGVASVLWAYALLLEGPRMLRWAPLHGRPRRVALAAVRICARLVGRQVLLALVTGSGGYALAETFAEPAAVHLGVVVAVAALIPRYGVTIGMVVLGLAAFVTSVEAGMITALVAGAYQQLVSRTTAASEVGRGQALAALGGGVAGLLMAGPATAILGVSAGWTAAAAGEKRRGTPRNPDR